MKIAAVIAAAGLSSRMGEFKPMLCIDGHTMIERVIGSLRQSGAEQIVVVSGYRSELLRRHLEPMDVQIVENRDYAVTKMFDSLCIGLRALRGPYDAVVITPGDVPLVRPETIRKILDCGAPVARPSCGGTVGHPLVLAAALVPQVLAYGGANGLRGAVQALGVPILDVAVDDEGVVMDADTKKDFAALRAQCMKNRSGGGICPELQIHIVNGTTILTPESAQLLEMIDHTGSIQTACACVHMSYSRGWRLLNQMEDSLGYALTARYPGGSCGGGSFLTERGRQLLGAYQTYRDRLQQMSEALFLEVFPEHLRKGGAQDANDLPDPAWGAGAAGRRTGLSECG